MALDHGDPPRIWAIGDLNRRARLAVVRDFRGQIWLAGELARIDDRRGHRYLQLVERGGGRDGRDAHLDAFCSASRWQRLAPKLAEAGVELRAGQRLMIQGSLDIGDRGHLTLSVDDVDIAALIGERARARQMLVQRLVADDLFDANRRQRLPPLPLRVGVVTSGGSDGHRDLMRQLEESAFAFTVTLRSVPVEGPAAPRSIQAALATFGPADTDVAVIVRGGGAKASLDAFDMPIVAHAIASAGIPVWTGIGHTGDRSVADEVAHRSFPTPSAVGQALVDEVTSARERLTRSVAVVAQRIDARLLAATSNVDGHRRELATLARSQLARHEHVAASAAAHLGRSARRGLDVRAGQVGSAAHAIRASGSAELRAATARLNGLALDAVGAARRRCVDGAADLGIAASAAATAATEQLRRAHVPVDTSAAALRRSRFDGLLDQQSASVSVLAQRALHCTERRLGAAAGNVSAVSAVLGAYDPARQLARGWTLTTGADGRLVRRIHDLTAGDTLITTLADGTATSTVTRLNPNDSEVPAP